jgi:RNA polymerase-binding transcription factor DksA
MYKVNVKKRKMDCTLCGEKIHPKRLEILPKTKTCVKCSTDAPKRGAIVMGGAGDHTWVDLMVMDQDQFDKYEKNKKVERKGGGLDHITD